MNLDLINIINTEDGRFLAKVNEINYLISKDIYTIIKELKEGNEVKFIIDFLNKNGSNYTNDEILNIIEIEIPKLLSNNEKSENPVKKIITLCETSLFEKTKFITDLFFLNKLFYFLFFIQIVVSIIFIKSNSSFFNSIFQFKKEWLVTFLFTFFIMFIHELGHAISAIKFNIKPPKIGLGFYFIYPAMFTDLTEIWRLGKMERIIINLSGMYFQLFINTIFILIFYTNILDNFYIFSFIFSNLMIICFNLNPLFKFDGYWIFSDYFDLPNLRSRSSKYIKNMFNAEYHEKDKKIKLYGFLFMIFMIIVWIYLVIHFYDSVRIISDKNIEFENKISPILTVILVLAIIFNLLKSKFIKNV